MKILSLTLVLIALYLFSCSSPADPDYNGAYTSANNATLNEALTLANDWKFSLPKITSFITATELHIEFPDGRKVTKSLPAESLLVSIAPYINKTHTCSTHYPSSCQGELAQQTFSLNVTDEQNNNIIAGEKITMKNGFFELWLPRNKTLSITISQNGRTAKEKLTTDNSCKTCITTAYLQ